MKKVSLVISPVVSLVILLCLAACSTRQPAPVIERVPSEPPRTPAASPSPSVAPAPTPTAPTSDWRPPSYTIKAGDTLYKIALDHGLDYRELAAWNYIENPNFIRVGQVLRLTAPGEPSAPSAATTAPLGSPPNVTESKPIESASAKADAIKTQPKAVKLAYSEQAMADLTKAVKPSMTASATKPTVEPSKPELSKPELSKPEPPAIVAIEAGDEDKVEWAWPATGKVIATFSENANLKGIDIGGKMGQPVLASAAGKVIYAGTGLRGYGKLIIIKHNKTYLSTYAHNKEILVTEGQQVTKGQKIAEMGNSDSEQIKLHFQIRRMGKPVDPAKFLPAAGS